METHDKTQEQNNNGGCQSGGCSCGNAVEQAPAEKAAEREVRRPVYVPAVDIIEGEKEVVLIANVPGVPEGGVDLTVDKGVLTLIASPADQGVEGGKLAYSEYGVGQYRRSFGLSDEIDKDNISASLKDGVLRITLPKSVSVAKKIAIAAN